MRRKFRRLTNFSLVLNTVEPTFICITYTQLSSNIVKGTTGISLSCFDYRIKRPFMYFERPFSVHFSYVNVYALANISNILSR